MPMSFYVHLITTPSVIQVIILPPNLDLKRKTDREERSKISGYCGAARSGCQELRRSKDGWKAPRPGVDSMEVRWRASGSILLLTAALLLITIYIITRLSSSRFKSEMNTNIFNDLALAASSTSLIR